MPCKRKASVLSSEEAVDEAGVEEAAFNVAVQDMKLVLQQEAFIDVLTSILPFLTFNEMQNFALTCRQFNDALTKSRDKLIQLKGFGFFPDAHQIAPFTHLQELELDLNKADVSFVNVIRRAQEWFQTNKTLYHIRILRCSLKEGYFPMDMPHGVLVTTRHYNDDEVNHIVQLADFEAVYAARIPHQNRATMRDEYLFYGVDLFTF